MKLIRLLDLGRTLVVGDIPMGRYQWVGRSGLPRFSGPRPAHLARLKETGAAGAQPTSRAAAGARSGRSFQVARVRASSPVASTAPAPAEVAPRASEPQPRLTAGLKTWWARLGSLVRRRSNPFSTENTPRTESGSPLQTSLRLDAVKVVRNDLSDSDFDVVARTQSRAVRPPPKAMVVDSVVSLSSAAAEASRARAEDLPAARAGSRV